MYITLLLVIVFIVFVVIMMTKSTNDAERKADALVECIMQGRSSADCQS